jgi:hypothetical protein
MPPRSYAISATFGLEAVPLVTADLGWPQVAHRR